MHVGEKAGTQHLWSSWARFYIMSGLRQPELRTAISKNIQHGYIYFLASLPTPFPTTPIDPLPSNLRTPPVQHIGLPSPDLEAFAAPGIFGGGTRIPDTIGTVGGKSGEDTPRLRRARRSPEGSGGDIRNE